ncbi:MAG: amidase [Gammaproteobacteria bacterium CG11_big_fil_rev_8_21_14_0_20_46_22]|nr:MAG: amidase [Gammaproteobacteria bacterium CG12_big_fil_rev_8_21_14_0_65_46_12]PIR10517.1 MAG: amidase [Gammaproteobacteria bacterium CG11_big_fil_rev_8_21_14_0_20_46_22]
MRLQYSTWPDVASYLEKHSGVIIPIGSTEQHGPTGLIGTDILCPELIAWEISAQQGVMVAPSLSLGSAQHHMAFAGSMTLRPSTMMAMIIDVVNSLAVHGFTHFFFLNGHGGNIAPIQAAFAEIHTQAMLYGGRRAHCCLQNWWKGNEVTKLIKALYGDAEGSHATPSEIALSYLVCSDKHTLEMQKVLSPEIAEKRLDFQHGYHYRERFPDGRMGSNPQLATLEHGKQFLSASVKDTFEAYQDFLKQD